MAETMDRALRVIHDGTEQDAERMLDDIQTLIDMARDGQHPAKIILRQIHSDLTTEYLED